MKRKREVLERFSVIVNFILTLSKILPKSFYLSLLKFIRNHDNYIAIFLRYVCLKNCAKSCGNNVAIFSGVYLYKIDQLEIGSNVSIHPMCYIDAGGGIKIGDDVSIAHASTVLSEEHKYSNLNLNIKDQGVDLKRTTIEKNVWVGAGSRILAGCKVNSGSIIAAGAVVKDDVGYNEVVGGVPAKVIKKRK